MAKSDFASGRAGYAQIEIKVVGLYPALQRWAKSDPMFNKEIRAASVQLIGKVVTKAQSTATTAPNRRQAIESARGLRARPDRVPIVKLSGSSNFVSNSRPNRRRSKNVTRGDVFFGSEFGSDRFRQFPARSPKFGAGNRGYWFWPTIEEMSEDIRNEYLRALDRILYKL
jgi:hypothetical protein